MPSRILHCFFRNTYTYKAEAVGGKLQCEYFFIPAEITRITAIIYSKTHFAIQKKKKFFLHSDLGLRILSRSTADNVLTKRTVGNILGFYEYSIPLFSNSHLLVSIIIILNMFFEYDRSALCFLFSS